MKKLTQFSYKVFIQLKKKKKKEVNDILNVWTANSFEWYHIIKSL